MALAIAKARVKGPSLPRNMVIMINIRPNVVRWVVIPIVRPTVPKADVVSNNNARKSAFSVIVSNSVTIVTRPPARRRMARDLYTWCCPIRR